MRFAITFAALMAAGPAMADSMVVRDGDSFVRLTQSPCRLSQVIPAEHIEKFKAAEVRMQGQDYVACWVVREDANVLVVDEDADAFVVPIVMFKREEGA